MDSAAFCSLLQLKAERPLHFVPVLSCLDVNLLFAHSAIKNLTKVDGVVVFLGG